MQRESAIAAFIVFFPKHLHVISTAVATALDMVAATLGFVNFIYPLSDLFQYG